MEIMMPEAIDLKFIAAPLTGRTQGKAEKVGRKVQVP